MNKISFINNNNNNNNNNVSVIIIVYIRYLFYFLFCYNKYHTLKGKKLIKSSITIPNTFSDPLYQQWMSKIIRPDALIHNKSKRIKLSTLSGLSSKDNDINSNVKGNPIDPSIIFVTVTNTFEKMTCMKIDKTVNQIVTGYRDSSVRVWRIGGNSFKPKSFLSMDEVIPKESFPPSSSSSAYNDIHNAKNKYQKSSEDSSSSNVSLLELKGHSLPVFGVDQDKTNRLILSSSADESVRLWDTVINQCVGRYNCLGVAWAVEFSPIGYYFATANQDKTMTIYSTDRISPIRIMTGHTSDVNCLNWHPNATLILSGSDEKTARVWDLRSAKCVWKMMGSSSPIVTVCISPYGNLIAAGSENGKIYIWDSMTSRLMGILQGHDGPIHSITFSGDNQSLISGGSDCSVRVW